MTVLWLSAPFVLICLLFIPNTLCVSYHVNMLVANSSDIQQRQWISLATLAAQQVSSAWVTDSLQLSIFDYGGDSTTAISYAIQSGQNASVSALIVIGSENLSDDLASIVGTFNLPAVSFDNPLSSLEVSPSVTFVHTCTSALYPIQTLTALLNKYGWTSIGVVYADNPADTTVASTVQSITGVGVTYVRFSSYSDDFSAPLQTIVRESLNVAVIINSNSTQVAELLQQAYNMGIYSQGRAIVVISQGSETIASAPLGTIIIQNQEADYANVTSFTSMMQALNPATYPETGPSASLFYGSIYAYDTINAISSAIQTAKSPSFSRSSLTSALLGLSYQGVSGLISFNATTGYRISGNAEILVANGDGTSFVSMVYQSNALQDIEAPIFPGNTSLIPDTSVIIYPIACIMALDTIPLPFATFAQVLAYASVEINRAGVLPDKTSFSLIMITQADLSSVILNTVPLIQYGVIGIMGALTSEYSIDIQNIAAKFNIPQISPTSTDDALSDKSTYPTFMRTCPPDDIQGNAIVNLAQIWGWTEIALLASTSPYGSGIAAIVTQAATAAGIRILTVQNVDPYQTDMTTEMGVLKNLDARILIMLVDLPGLAVNEMYRLGYSPKAVVGSDTLAVASLSQFVSDYNFPLSFIQGWVTLIPSAANGLNFTDYLAGIQANPPVENPNGVYDLVATGGFYLCTTIDIFYVFANAVTRILGNGGDPRNGTTMLSALYDTHINGLTGSISFNSNGDRIGPYDVMNFVGDNEVVANRYYPDGTLQVFQPIIWPGGSTDFPLSTIPRNQTWLEWNGAAGITLAVFGGLGMAFSTGTLFVIFHERASPIIRSATYEFLILMVIGAMLGYGSIFTWIGKPVPYICGLRIWLPPMAFILIMAPLLAKTWRLHRIFSLRDFKLDPIPLWRLVLFAGCLILVQLILCIFWISLGTVEPYIVNDTTNLGISYVLCSYNKASRIISYVTYAYEGFIMLVGGYFAFRVRNLPKDFNESRWIGFSIYNSMIFSGIILILGYTLSSQPVTVLILICICTLAIATGCIGLMMSPKLWELLMHPERRSSATDRNSTRLASIAKSSYSVKEKTSTSNPSRQKSDNTGDGDSSEASSEGEP